jgi:anhydro-N-acetylmuramic acid kinase
VSQTANRGIGLMCGTSHDGIDICDVTFERSEKHWNYTVHHTQTVSLNTELQKSLADATKMSAIEYVQLDEQIARFTANAVNAFIKNSNSKASFLASHGVTVFHQPEKGLSTQIGSGAIISALTGLKTVCDFRLQDVTKGGQGAPLVPLADSMLFGSYDATLNLGGFANISILNGAIKGFDICACNILLNYLSMQSGHRFDEGGKMAMSGQMIPALLEQLNNLSFFDLKGPKSLGKEWFDDHIMPIIAAFDHARLEDVIATSVEHMAFQIGMVLTQVKCLVTGGGAHNDYLVERIKHYSRSKIIVPDHAIIDFKEAICFAFLGHLRLLEMENVSGKVTGAIRNSSAGAIYLP